MTVLLLIVAFCAAAIGQPPAPLTNADLVAMKKAGLDDQTLIQAIRTKASSFDTSVAALVALKKSGLSESLISEVLTASRRPTQAHRQRLDDQGLPLELGVYARIPGEAGRVEVVELRPEPFQFLDAATAKLTWKAWLGLGSGGDYGHYGVLRDRYSATRATQSSDLIFRCPPGTAPEEFLLLPMVVTRNLRMFQVAKSKDEFESRNRIDRIRIVFESERIAPQVYRVGLKDLTPGEYGLLPPGALRGRTGADAGDGVVYGFSIR